MSCTESRIGVATAGLAAWLACALLALPAEAGRPPHSAPAAPATPTVMNAVKILGPEGQAREMWIRDELGGLERRLFDPKGRLVRSEPYRGELVHGSVVDYRPDGTTLRRVGYRAGVREGRITEFYRNGRVRVEGWNSAGVPSGVWRYWSPSGELLRTVDHGVAR